MKEGRASPTPHAVAQGRQRPRCGGVRQRRLLCVATATPQSRCGNAQRRRCWALPPYVGSRFSLKQRPCFLSGGMTSAQGFLSTWSLEPTAIPEEVDRVVMSSPAPPQALGAAADRTPPPGAGAPGASTKDKPASDRPSPHSVLVHTSTHSPAAPGRKASSCRSEWRAAGSRWRTAAAGGLHHSKLKNLSHAT